MASAEHAPQHRRLGFAVPHPSPPLPPEEPVKYAPVSARLLSAPAAAPVAAAAAAAAPAAAPPRPMAVQPPPPPAPDASVLGSRRAFFALFAVMDSPPGRLALAQRRRRGLARRSGVPVGLPRAAHDRRAPRSLAQGGRRALMARSGRLLRALRPRGARAPPARDPHRDRPGRGRHGERHLSRAVGHGRRGDRWSRVLAPVGGAALAVGGLTWIVRRAGARLDVLKAEARACGRRGGRRAAPGAGAGSRRWPRRRPRRGAWWGARPCRPTAS